MNPDLFENDFPDSWARNIRCVNCTFDFITPKVRKPYLLNCKHTICEKCVEKKSSVICQKCNSEQKTLELEINFHVYGYLWYKTQLLTAELESRIRKNPKAPEKQNSNNIYCVECSKSQAAVFCFICTVNLCHRCFRNFHNKANFLKTHRYKQLYLETDKQFTISTKTCKYHKSLMEYFCQHCEKPFCGECSSKTHYGHSTCSILEENENHLEEITEFLEQVRSNSGICQQSLKVTKSVDISLETIARKAISDINGYFFDLHGVLQIVERDLLLDLKSKFMPILEKVQQTNDTLETTSRIMNKAYNILEEFLNNVPRSSLIKDVFKKIEDTLNASQYSIDFGEIQENPLTLNLPDILSQTALKKQIVLKFMDSLPKNDVLKDLQLQRTPNISRRNSILSENLQSTSGSKSDTPVKDISSIFEVTVTEIISPEQIFVIPNNVKNEKIRHFNNYCRQLAERSYTPDHFEIKNYALGFNEMDSTWYRCVILEKLELLQYKVRLLDYGTSLILRKGCLKAIPDEGLNESFHCYKCKLFDIAPYSGQWNEKSIFLMIEMINNSPVTLILKNVGKTLVVDLITKKGCSIRDAMVASKYGREHGYSRANGNEKFQKLRAQHIKKNNHKFFISSFSTNDIFQAKCSAIRDPSNFYVVKEENLIIQSELYSAMTEFYDKNRDRNHLYSLDYDMPCAFKFESVWYRAKVLHFDKDFIDIRLVDDGKTFLTKWTELYELSEEFVKLSELAINCSLAHVKPLDEETGWSKKSIDEFKNLIRNKCFEVSPVEKSKNTYKVVLRNCKTNLNINSLFCANNFAISTGEHSAVANLPTELQTNKKNVVELNKDLVPKRTKILISHIETPGEFYIQIEDYMSNYSELQKRIQEELEAMKVNHSLTVVEDPEVGNIYMVYSGLADKPKQWFRAKFKTKVETKHCVFLIDYGRTIYVSKLFKIPQVFENIASTVLKCHMACIKPTGGMPNWSATSIDQLKLSLTKYESISVSKSSNCPEIQPNSMCVFLWGLKSEDKGALLPRINKSFNINYELCNIGVAHKTADILEEDNFDFKFNASDDIVCAIPWNKISTNAEDLEDSEAKINLEGPIIVKARKDHYLKPKPISKVIFTGYPTYVDHEAVVYLHDLEGKKYIEQINKNVKAFLESEEWRNHELNRICESFDSATDYFEPGQACLARFHFDNQFYRAEVLSFITDGFKVRFVDYGNEEECKFSDLYNVTAYPLIPMQSHKYKLYGIKPPNNEPRYSIHALDVLHKLIVDTICQVRVENKNISNNSSSSNFSSSDDLQFPQCYLKVPSNYDVAEYMILKKLAGCSDSNMLRMINERKHFSLTIENAVDLSDSPDEKAEILEPSPPVRDDNKFFEKGLLQEEITHEEYKNFFTVQREMDGIISNTLKKFELNNNEDVIELDSSFVPKYWDKNKFDEESISDVEASYDGFDPKETSSTKFVNGIGPFCFRKFDKRHLKFYCEVYCVDAPTIICITPAMDEFKTEFYKIQKLIEEALVRSHRFEKLRPNMACLARHPASKVWYRGIIQKVSHSELYVRVLFVDIMDMEEVSREHIKSIPEHLLNISLRCSRVELVGVHPNGRYREKLIRESLAKILVRDNKQVYADIINPNARFPKVKLYENEKCEVLAYEPLIKEKYFLT